MSDYINFKSFVDDYVAIEIPILQRDYAQGRAAQNNLGTLNAKGANFLAFLMEALENGHQQELDFIYGSCEIRNEQNANDKTFLPLDGQQRLTTLWLLHWYLAQTNNKMDEWQNKLAKFTYATRTSARDFCKHLVGLRLDVEQLKSPSKTIKGYLWFTSAYASDPTIDAMLRMLDAIADQFEARAEELTMQMAMERLDNIVFRVFDIGTYGLSDELYIKMNGRGRALSAFENFKADFLGYLKKQDGFADEVREVSRKLDHAWAEMVWGAKQNEDFDMRYIRLFKRYLYNLWVINHRDYKEKDKTPDVLTNTFSGEAYVNFAPYAKLLNNSEEEEVRKMSLFFDFLVSEQEKEYRKFFFAPWKEEKSEYPYMMDKKVSMVDRLTLFALSEYVANSNTSNLPLENFEQWMRIVHHLLADPQLRTYRVQLDYMKAIRTLAVHAHEIESYLKELDINSLDFSNSIKTRLEHEKEKLNYLDTYANRREALLQLEKHGCLKGQVKFALDFDGNDDEFIVFCEKAAKLISDNDDWSAKHLWPAVIAKCDKDKDIFDLSNPRDYDYFRHKEQKSDIQWRLQDLLNREGIAAAFREVVKVYVTSCQNNQGGANFEAVSKAICDNYNGSPYHANLIKLLPKHWEGRIYRRDNGKLCLQTSWRVTQNNGYFNLEETNPVMMFE